ncbi:MaoC/PaaZ C-terminal domain-containing protein [Acrocarpospora sp. B8E8]|uniref:MaoC/PaaZ C-terminal domain-containing protein n=1 Tax=Acrocarpospora sp. B8E8 TaxID=3153572 RepID=UPI00325D3F8A
MTKVISRSDIEVGQELPAFSRETGFAVWNRYAAVNDEFVPIHMDDEAGRAAGYPSAFGMGNLQWAYLHNAIRDWMGDGGRIAALSCQFRGANTKGMTLTVSGTVTAVRDEDGTRYVDLAMTVKDQEGKALAPATATVAFDG